MDLWPAPRVREPVDLTVSLPGIDPAEARKLVDSAHQICPYSNATRGNHIVGLTLA